MPTTKSTFSFNCRFEYPHCQMSLKFTTEQNKNFYFTIATPIQLKYRKKIKISFTGNFFKKSFQILNK